MRNLGWYKRRPMRRLALLGPQRQQPILASVLDALELGGRLAAITAGWQEREGEVGNLDEHIGRTTTNLRLYERSDDVFARHPELHEALRERRHQLHEAHQLYKLRLAGLLDATRELIRRDGDPGLLEPQRREAIEQVRVVDRQHIRRLSAIRGRFGLDNAWDSFAAVVEHREAVREQLVGCEGLLIAGGHVLVLLNRLHMFGIDDALLTQPDLPVIGWSAGAMALSEWIVLFHHRPPQGANNTQVSAPGLGVARGVVAFPHASRRLTLDQPPRVALMARRFAPAVCCALDSGGWVQQTQAGWRGHGTARRLGVDGQLGELRP